VAWLWPPYELQADTVEESTHATFLVRVPFRAYGRNPYVRHGAQDESAPPPPEQGDAASGILVVPSWGAYRLTRASRLYYYRPALDTPVVAEPPTWSPFLVRLPLKGYKPNRYRFNTAQDVSAPGEPEVRRDFLVRLPFKRYTPTRYRFHVSPHDSVVVPEPPTHPPHPTRPKDRLEARYKYAMGARTRYNFHHATDQGVVIPIFAPWWAEDVNLIFEDDGITR
jgi:hypothetical protein